MGFHCFMWPFEASFLRILCLFESPELIENVKLIHKPVSLQPRGLVNKGNWCYINAVSFHCPFIATHKHLVYLQHCIFTYKCWSSGSITILFFYLFIFLSKANFHKGYMMYLNKILPLYYMFVFCWCLQNSAFHCLFGNQGSKQSIQIKIWKTSKFYKQNNPSCFPHAVFFPDSEHLDPTGPDRMPSHVSPDEVHSRA